MSADKILATPAAKRLARERGVDLSRFRGTGPLGSILVRDIDNMQPAQRITPVAKKMAEYLNIDLGAVQSYEKITKAYVEEMNRQQSQQQSALTGHVVPIRGMRKVIAERMQESMQTAPQYTIHSELDTTKFVGLLKDLKAVFAAKGTKLSFTDLMIKMTALALQKHPIINASIVGEEIVYHEQANIGVAVALDEGLIVPVVRNANQLSLEQISSVTSDLVARAREGALAPDEYSGGTFTISNMGMYPVDYFTPIINQPESGILGIGRTVEKPVGVEGKIELRSLTAFSLTLDHRLVDGVVGGQFMATLSELLTNPLALIV